MFVMINEPYAIKRVTIRHLCYPPALPNPPQNDLGVPLELVATCVRLQETLAAPLGLA